MLAAEGAHDTVTHLASELGLRQPTVRTMIYLAWPIDDQVGPPLASVRGIRDDIDTRVHELLATVT